MDRKWNQPTYLQLSYLFLLTLLFAGIYYYCFSAKIFLGGDNIYYYNLGKALAEGKGYVTLNLPNTPLASHYPPGYPSIIALMMISISKSIIAIKILNGIFLLGSLITSFYLFKKLTNNLHLSFVGSLLIILNPKLLEYGSIMMSEVPFLFFSLLTLLLFVITDKKKAPLKQGIFYAFILSLVITFHIKTIGISLVAGFIFYLLLSKKWHWILSVLSGFILLSLPWGIRDYLIGGNSYLNQLMMVNPYRPELGQAGFSDFLHRFLNNAQQYIAVEIPYGIFPFFKGIISSYSLLSWTLGITILLAILVGIFQLKDKYSHLIGGYLIGIFSILFLWPNIWTDIRFLIPVLPLLIFTFLVGVYQLLFYLFKKNNSQNYIHPLYLLAFAIYFIPGLADLNLKSQEPHPSNWQVYIEMAKWAKNNTQHDVIISCRKPAVFYLFSDRKTFRFKDTPDHIELLQDLKNHNTDYVVLDQLGFPSTSKYLFPALQKYENKFEVTLKSRGIESYLLKFKSGSLTHD